MSNPASGLTIERTAKGPMVATITKMNGGVLATGLFGAPVDVGYHYTPKQCPNYGHIWVLDQWTGEVIGFRCQKRSCPACRERLAFRIERQIDYEEINVWAIVPTPQWEVYRKRLRRKGLRYKLFNFDGYSIAVSHVGDYDLPVGQPGRIELIDHWLELMPLGRRENGNWIGGKRTGGTKAVWSISAKEAEETGEERVLITPGFGGKQWANARKQSQPGRYWGPPSGITKDEARELWRDYLETKIQETNTQLDIHNHQVEFAVRVVAVPEFKQVLGAEIGCVV